MEESKRWKIIFFTPKRDVMKGYLNYFPLISTGSAHNTAAYIVHLATEHNPSQLNPNAAENVVKCGPCQTLLVYP